MNKMVKITRMALPYLNFAILIMILFSSPTIFNSNTSINQKGDKGDNAYQVWLEAGYKGSTRDFFSFIKGEQGETGHSGQDSMSNNTIVEKQTIKEVPINGIDGKSYESRTNPKTCQRERREISDSRWQTIEIDPDCEPQNG